MLGYMTIGALDTAASAKFYDAVLGAIGYARNTTDGDWLGWGPKGSKASSLYICPPFDGKPARAGNGIMVAIRAGTQDMVRAAHTAALKNGGTDEGAPGPRPADSKDYYGAYMRDPVGNKLCIYWKP